MSDEDEQRTSRVRLEISLSIGYQRKRAAVEGAWEGRMITVALIVLGAIVVLYFLYSVFRELRLVS